MARMKMAEKMAEKKMAKAMKGKGNKKSVVAVMAESKGTKAGGKPKGTTKKQ